MFENPQDDIAGYYAKKIIDAENELLKGVYKAVTGSEEPDEHFTQRVDSMTRFSILYKGVELGFIERTMENGSCDVAFYPTYKYEPKTNEETC